jgi:hypothetical protein
MVGVWRSVKQKVVGVAAVAVLLAGGAIAAVSATGQSNSRGDARADCASHRRHAHERDLAAAAAAYLGVSHASLNAQLRSGKTLAQIADATAGKSTARLVDALVAARRSGLADATAAGRLTQARLAKRVARLDKRMNALVQRRFTGARSSS